MFSFKKAPVTTPSPLAEPCFEDTLDEANNDAQQLARNPNFIPDPKLHDAIDADSGLASLVEIVNI